LLYVGITRAREQMLLTSARQRRFYGDMHYPIPSRFIKKLPADLLRHPDALTVQSTTEQAAGGGINLGSNVTHPSFGDGVILSLEGSGDAARVTVQFRKAGTKRLMLKYAALQIL